MENKEVNVVLSYRELRQVVVAVHQGEEYLRNRRSESGLYVYGDLADVYADLAAKLDKALLQVRVDAVNEKSVAKDSKK